MAPGPLTVPQITSVKPVLGLPGGRVTLEGGPFAADAPSLPTVRVGGVPARVVLATPRRMTLLIPPGLAGGQHPVRLDDAPGASIFVEIGVEVATGIHQVDNPAIDEQGTVYLTCSGSRGQQTPVSVYRVRKNGPREVFVTGLTNATSLAIGPDGRLYVSSRFDGTVSRIDEDGRAEVVASDLGIACGLAFGADGTMFVGDRSGTVLRIYANDEAKALASLPPSVAAYHLAVAPDGALFVTGPTLASRDHVYRITPDGEVREFASSLGRPQGMALDPQGRLHVVEALAGAAGLYRLGDDGAAELVLSAPSLVGVAFDALGGLVVASNDTAWRFTGVPRG